MLLRSTWAGMLSEVDTQAARRRMLTVIGSPVGMTPPPSDDLTEGEVDAWLAAVADTFTRLSRTTSPPHYGGGGGGGGTTGRTY